MDQQCPHGQFGDVELMGDILDHFRRHSVFKDGVYGLEL